MNHIRFADWVVNGFADWVVHLPERTDTGGRNYRLEPDNASRSIQYFSLDRAVCQMRKKEVKVSELGFMHNLASH